MIRWWTVFVPTNSCVLWKIQLQDIFLHLSTGFRFQLWHARSRACWHFVELFWQKALHNNETLDTFCVLENRKILDGSIIFIFEKTSEKLLNNFSTTSSHAPDKLEFSIESSSTTSSQLIHWKNSRKIYVLFLVNQWQEEFPRFRETLNGLKNIRLLFVVYYGKTSFLLLTNLLIFKKELWLLRESLNFSFYRCRSDVLK